MKLQVLYFASLRDRTGTAGESVEVPSGARVSELWDLLRSRHPGLREVPVRPLVACDLEFAGWERPLEGVREIAFLPPVSGG